MLVIRFSRVGKRNHAQYKIVVAEKSAPIKGRFVEQLGSYDPHMKQAMIKENRIKYWIDQGAQVTDSVWNLLVREGVLKGGKKAVVLRPKKGGKDASEAPEKKVEAGDTPEDDPTTLRSTGATKGSLSVASTSTSKTDKEKESKSETGNGKPEGDADVEKKGGDSKTNDADKDTPKAAGKTSDTPENITAPKVSDSAKASKDESTDADAKEEKK